MRNSPPLLLREAVSRLRSQEGSHLRWDVLLFIVVGIVVVVEFVVVIIVVVAIVFPVVDVVVVVREAPFLKCVGSLGISQIALDL